jgi:hypothetical protein
VRRVIVLFLDGVGLGADDPDRNPLARPEYPELARLLGGKPLTASTGYHSSDEASLISVDAILGVGGRPQSATGQAAILTGVNAPQRLGEHFGPRPDNRVRAVLDEGTIFSRLRAAGKRTYFVNGYPDGYFRAIESGKRLLSAIPYAATQAGQILPTKEDVRDGLALSADFTGAGWRKELGYADAPLYTPEEAGRKIWAIAQQSDLLFFEHWMSDVIGHNQAMDAAVENLRTFDGVLGGLFAAADLDETLILVVSDHGNMEDLSHGKHTLNPALGIALGANHQEVAGSISSLVHFASAIENFLLDAEK